MNTSTELAQGLIGLAQTLINQYGTGIEKLIVNLVKDGNSVTQNHIFVG